MNLWWPNLHAIMVQLSAGMDASVGTLAYERHRPERTLFYQLVDQYYPAFVTQLAAEGKILPDYVHQEFEALRSYFMPW